MQCLQHLRTSRVVSANVCVILSLRLLLTLLLNADSIASLWEQLSLNDQCRIREHGELLHAAVALHKYIYESGIHR